MTLNSSCVDNVVFGCLAALVVVAMVSVSLSSDRSVPRNMRDVLLAGSAGVITSRGLYCTSAQAEQRGAAFLQHIVSLDVVKQTDRRFMLLLDDVVAETPITSSACNVRTVVDLATALAPSVTALGPCAVAEHVPDDQQLQQHLFQACEHQRSKVVVNNTPKPYLWHSIWGGQKQTTQNTPRHVHIICPRNTTSEAAQRVWLQYDTLQAVHGGMQPLLVWEIAAAAANGPILVYDSKDTLPTVQQLEELLPSAHRPLLIIRTAETAVGETMPVDVWVRTMQSYAYVCMMVAPDGAMMQATGCLSDALESAAGGGADVVCVWRGVSEKLLARWGVL